MHEALNRISIRATPEQIMALAFDLPAWPKFLPHYRWVAVLAQDGERATVEMACWRSFGPLRWPLKWRSHLWVDHERRRMRFHHIGGPARGMDVEWLLRPDGDRVEVSIRHDLSLEVPLVRTALGKWIVAEIFVRAVAGRTLACLKEAVEAA